MSSIFSPYNTHFCVALWLEIKVKSLLNRNCVHDEYTNSHSLAANSLDCYSDQIYHSAFQKILNVSCSVDPWLKRICACILFTITQFSRVTLPDQSMFEHVLTYMLQIHISTFTALYRIKSEIQRVSAVPNDLTERKYPHRFRLSPRPIIARLCTQLAVYRHPMTNYIT